MIINDSYNYFEEFSSLKDFREGLARPMTGRFVEKHSSDDIRKVWFGTHTWEDAEELLANGYDVGAEKLMKKVLSIHNTAQRPRQVASVVGYSPIVPNALRGVPKTMFATKSAPKVVPLRKVFIVNTAGALIEADKLLESGAVMLNVCNQLEMAGVRTQIVSIPKFSYTVNKKREVYSLGCSIKLKDYREQFSFKKMAYVIAHVSMFRRHGFRYVETCGAKVSFKNRFVTTYGISYARVQKETVDKLKEMGVAKDGDIILTYGLIAGCGFNLESVMQELGLKK